MDWEFSIKITIINPEKKIEAKNFVQLLGAQIGYIY